MVNGVLGGGEGVRAACEGPIVAAVSRYGRSLLAAYVLESSDRYVCCRRATGGQSSPSVLLAIAIGSGVLLAYMVGCSVESSGVFEVFGRPSISIGYALIA